MREITHTGASAPFNFTIEAPDEKVYIFSPNILRVTLGSGYSATQEVKISGEGVTLKRRAIDRVVTFDLSTIFRAPFRTRNFEIDYTNFAADPFFYNLINLTITASETETEDVLFFPQWGALQMGEEDSIVNITFPFWAGYPIAINTDIRALQWDINLLSLSGDTGELAVPVATNDFTYRVEYELLTFQSINFYKTICPINGHYLRWVDARGRIWHYMFTAPKMTTGTKDIRTASILQRYPMSEDEFYRGRQAPTRKDVQRSIRLYANYDNDIAEIMESVLSSPLVAMYKNNVWVGVVIEDTSVTRQRSWMSDMEFSVRLPSDYVQEI